MPLVVDTTKKVIAETRSETFSHEPKSQLEERKNDRSLEIMIKESQVVPAILPSEVQSPVIKSPTTIVKAPKVQSPVIVKETSTVKKDEELGAGLFKHLEQKASEA